MSRKKSVRKIYLFHAIFCIFFKNTFFSTQPFFAQKSGNGEFSYSILSTCLLYDFKNWNKVTFTIKIKFW